MTKQEMANLRDTIARAVQHSDAWMGCDDEGWTCPGKECRYCWEVAQGCADAVIAALGPLIAATARAETTTDLHWSNAAAAEYPGDEYEQYPLRTAFGRGVKWERKRAIRKEDA